MAFKFIGRAAFITYTPTCSPAASADFPVTNLLLYDALLRPYNSSDTTNDIWITLNKGSATVSIGLLIDDLNFTGFKLYHGTSSNSTTNEVTVVSVKDERTQRYRHFYDSTHSSQYIRIKIPSGTPTTDSTNYYRIGRVVIGSSATNLTQNIFWPYTYTAPKKYATVEFESGSEEIVNLGSQKIFQCEFGISALKSTNEGEWWTLDSVDEDQLMVMYENNSDTSKAYVVQRKGSLTIQELTNTVRSFSTYILKEKI